MTDYRRSATAAPTSRPRWPLVLLALGLGCNGSAVDEKSVGPEVITIALGDGRSLERAPVLFDHRAHAEALQAEGCRACHERRDDGSLVPTIVELPAEADRDDTINAYHLACLGCHEKRAKRAAGKTGPQPCGACHAEANRRTTVRREPMRYDYSLHFRHARALGEKRCDACHHVYDEMAKKLAYKEGAEAACSDCHRERDEKKKIALRKASHRACITCHQRRADDAQRSGPVACRGCHDAAAQRRFERIVDPPRPQRGQADLLWIGAKQRLAGTRGQGRIQPVRFDHRRHEGRAAFCTTCHHDTLAACGSCHGVTEAKKGGGLRAERAFHHASSPHGCVGCHAEQTMRADCAGCHRELTEVPSPRGCRRCHDGPDDPVLLQTPPATMPVAAALDPLPAVDPRRFPQTVVIEVLAQKYEPSKLPHAKIVARLDAIVRKSSLASHFHGSTDALCAGCHHRTPRGAQPPPCRSCHGERARATEDRPALLAAYHRQCIGCHRQMKIKAVGCTDCHAKKGSASLEVSR